MADVRHKWRWGWTTHLSPKNLAFVRIDYMFQSIGNHYLEAKILSCRFAIGRL